MNLISKVFLLITPAILFVSCAKEESRDSSVPYARVDININLILQHEFYNPLHSKKYYANSDGILYAGYAGVLAISNQDASWIYAYDLCCPYEAPLKNEIEISGSLRAKCPKCGSVYNLMNGGRAESGPAKDNEATARLRNYSVVKSSDSYRIYN